jgi:hypothetical protein
MNSSFFMGMLSLLLVTSCQLSHKVTSTPEDMSKVPGQDNSVEAEQLGLYHQLLDTLKKTEATKSPTIDSMSLLFLVHSTNKEELVFSLFPAYTDKCEENSVDKRASFTKLITESKLISETVYKAFKVIDYRCSDSSTLTELYCAVPDQLTVSALVELLKKQEFYNSISGDHRLELIQLFAFLNSLEKSLTFKALAPEDQAKISSGYSILFEMYEISNYDFQNRYKSTHYQFSFGTKEQEYLPELNSRIGVAENGYILLLDCSQRIGNSSSFSMKYTLLRK